MRNKELMASMLRRMANDPSGHLAVVGLTAEQDHACSLLEDKKLAEWVGRYPYGYRITAAGYDWLDEKAASSE